MRMRIGIGAAVLLLAIGALQAFQRPFREYPGIEYNDFPLPPDAAEKTEFTFARLMYAPSPFARGGFRGNRGGNWTQGFSMWTQDYPRADRHFLRALRRLTRIHTRSVEQPINLDDGDDVFNWPWLYAVQVGHWQLSDEQAHKLREYLDRGGFFMCDDFWGPQDYDVMQTGMQKVFPDRQIEDLDDSEPLFHSVYNLNDRYQVPGARYRWSGVTYKCENCPAHWLGIHDEKRRVVVAMTQNSDLGDSWEFADDPTYDERYSALGIRIALNYIVYSMTH